MEASALVFGPCSGLLVELEDALSQIEFFGPQKVVLVEAEGVEAVLHKSCTERESRWAGGIRTASLGRRRIIRKSSGREAAMG